MTVNSVQIYEYRCDNPNCRSVHEQRNASGHYWEGVPPDWSKVSILANGAKQSIYNIRNVLLCSNCSHEVMSLAHALKEKGIQ